MKNKCKHKSAQCLTPKGSMFPMSSANWYWCPDFGATQLESLMPNPKKYPWKAPKLAVMAADQIWANALQNKPLTHGKPRA